MQPKQLQDELLKVQDAIYGVALALDSFLVNGIQYGVLQGAVFPGFLKKTANSLLTALANLEQHASDAYESKIREVQAGLQAKCQEIIDRVSALGGFRTLPHELLHETVSRILALREECVQLIQELEAAFQTPNQFYQTRPAHSSAMLDHFLGNLERLFEVEQVVVKE
jgi:hypothetical protein